MILTTDLLSRYKNPDFLLSDLGIEEPEDIDIEAIAQYCGATVCYEELKSHEGRIVGYGNKAIITVNKNSIRERQRFSVAHELGHWMFHRGKTYFCSEDMFNNEWGDSHKYNRQEVTANEYAADLLLPDSIFESMACNKEITFDTVKYLAGKFNTSLTATAMRLVKIGSLHGMVIFSDGQKRLWFVRGPEVSEKLWPVKTIDKKANITKIIKEGIARTNPEEVPAHYWIDHDNSHDYYVCEDSIKVWNNLYLTLIWWKDERQLLDLDRGDTVDDSWDPKWK